MKKKNGFLLLSMLLVLSLFVAACGNDEASTGDDPEYLSMLTGGTSGTYYPLGGAMAKIITDETGVQTDAVSSNASADNVIALKEGNAELAFVQTDVVANAIEGVNAFEGEPVDNVMAIGSLYPETIQIVTTANSGISSVEDLRGKTVSVGAPGSGTYINAEQILEVHGMTMDDIDVQNLDFGESTGGIQDGNIDAAFITAGTPTGAVEGLAATTEISIVPIAQDKVDELIASYPYYAAEVIPAGTYNLEEEVSTVAVLAMLAVTADLSEDLVYNITKAIYENTDKIGHAKNEFITLETATDGIGIDFHPGAEKYFKEEGLMD
ncbi:TAXI family TRAP transporter solute-binding subunit [Sutcliffiella deserti]|uniref:TAXI family TRAP transporter solute-binding subunit n=1 Tax=Sutcliffiella deserti TaxID=2875501 RepID=UPI001CBFF435|nr:TAXI family TRAP transporter solute-binding subunit [Sutcliffiella deserti]